VTDAHPAQRPLPTHWAWWFIVPFVFVLVADLWSKAAIFSDGRQEGDELAWWCELAWNRGMAWGIGNSMPQVVLILTLVLIPVLAGLWWWLYRRDGRATNVAFGCILGGALGNAYDRIMTAMATDGSGFQGVRDFIRIDLRMVGIAYTWPNFNVADAALTIGFVLLLILPWITRPRASAPPDLT
jgi:signal peptidase II